MGQLTNDTAVVATLIQGLQAEIELQIDSIEVAHTTLFIDESAIKNAASDGLKNGLTESGIEGIEDLVVDLVAPPGWGRYLLPSRVAKSLMVIASLLIPLHKSLSVIPVTASVR